MNRPPPSPAAANPELYSNPVLLGRLFGLVWQHKGRCLGVMALQVAQLVLGLAGLSFVGLGIDYLRTVVEPGLEHHPLRWPLGWAPGADWAPMQVMAAVAGGILLLAMVRALLNYLLTTRLNMLVQGKVVVDLRARVYEKLQVLSWRFFDHQSVGAIINRVTGDVQAVRMFVDGVFLQAFIMVLSLAVYFHYMAGIHLPLTLACLATAPVIWVLSARFSAKIRPAYDKNRELMDRLVLDMAENIQGMQTIKAFGLEGRRREIFAERNTEVLEQRRSIFDRVSTFSPTIGMLSHINLFILLCFGGWLAIHGQIPVGGGLVVFAGLLQQFTNQVANVAGLVDSAQQSLAGARRVFEVLDAPVEVQSPPDPVRLERVRGEIEFENVSFEYAPNNSVLREISFLARPGQIVAIVGATGSGKSALMNLIPRFYDPRLGSVKLDGVDVRRLDLQQLRHAIGIVYQESFLFSNTVAANISFGFPDASRAQIEKAARIAAAHDFIMALPKGYDTLVAEGGTNLSGGQRQRLAIARALLREPPVLLFDDPTAAIDPETEHEIMEAIENAIAGRTTFIVAHRLSTLQRADLILVLERGRIVQRGTHDELMAVAGPYRRAARVQMIDAVSLEILQRKRAEKARAAGAPA